MKRLVDIFACSALICGLLVGCATPQSPYVSVENWVIRQNAVPSYFASYDLIFIYPYIEKSKDRYPSLPSDKESSAYLHDFTAFVTQESFGKKVRVFAPIVHRTKDSQFAAILSPEREAWDETVIVPSVRETIEAIRFYLKTYHQPGHPYVLLGHGQGALYIQEALKELEDEVLPSDGFIAAYLPNLPEVAFRQLGADFSEGNIRLARGKLDTGVVAAWRVGTGPVTNRQEDASNLVSAGAINPLNWSMRRPASSDLCIGAYYYDCANTNVLSRKVIVPNFCRAEPDGSDGILRVAADVRPDLPLAGETIAPFLGNIVENAASRVVRYRCKRRWKGWTTETAELPIEDEVGAEP